MRESEGALAVRRAVSNVERRFGGTVIARGKTVAVVLTTCFGTPQLRVEAVACRASMPSAPALLTPPGRDPKDDAAIVRLLHWHDTMRRRGQSVLTTFVGRPYALADLHRTWCSSRGRLRIELHVAEAHPSAMVEAWLAASIRDFDLLPRLLRAIGTTLNDKRLAARWERLGDAERTAVVDELRDRRQGALARIASEISGTRHGLSFRGEGPTRARAPDEDTLADILDSLPSDVVPHAWVSIEREVTPEHVETMLGLVEAFPQLPLAWVSSPGDRNALLAALRSSRTKSTFERGMIEVEAATATSARDAGLAEHERRTISTERARAGAAAPPLDELVDIMVGDHDCAVIRNGAEALAIEGLEALQRVQTDTSEGATDRARSLAERILHLALERRRTTRGAFVLNADMPFSFGNRPAEVDLYAACSQIAVEVDGWHHFRDADRYRRDRRKDVLLQRHDCFVLRFLAQDVYERPREIVDEIETIHRIRMGKT